MFASDFSRLLPAVAFLMLLQAFAVAGWGFAVYRTASAIRRRAGMRWAMLLLPLYALGWIAVFGFVYGGGSMIIRRLC